MCNCMTSWDIIDKINEKRAKAGLEQVDYNWLMSQHRKKWVFIKPARKIGPSNVWDRSSARKIVSVLWDLPFKSHPLWSIIYQRAA